jgi:hypothetical protein
MEVVPNRVLTVRRIEDRIVVEHYCECLRELRVSVFTPDDEKVNKLTGFCDLPFMSNPRPIPQDVVERLVHDFVKELDDLSTFNA